MKVIKLIASLLIFFYGIVLGYFTITAFCHKPDQEIKTQDPPRQRKYYVDMANDSEKEDGKTWATAFNKKSVWEAIRENNK